MLRPIMRTALWAFLALDLFAQSTYTVEGTVSFTNGAPAGGVSVDLRKLEATSLKNETAYTAASDDKGQFRFANVAAGQYIAAYRKSGFHAVFSTAEPSEGGSIVNADQPFSAPVFKVGPAAAHIKLTASLDLVSQFTGRVVDEEGKPLPKMTVVAASADSRIVLASITGADGRFSITARTGSYYLFASRHFFGPRISTDSQPSMEDNLRFWYPGVIHSDEAQEVRLRAGVQFYEIKVRSVPSYRVRGVVLDDKGDPTPGVQVSLYQIDRLDTGGFASVTSAPDGTFGFKGVAEGKWRLFAVSGVNPAKRSGQAEIFVSRRDLENAELRLAPASNVIGSVEPDDDSGTPPVKRVSLSPFEFPFRGEFAAMEAQVEGDGRFRLEAVYPGRYRIVAPPAAGKYYLASVLVGDRETLGDPVDLREGTPPVRVVYRSGGGTVVGTVEKCVGATVVLVPEEPALFDLFVRRVPCDNSGHFEMSYLRPGNYSLLAFRDPNLPRGAAFLRPYLPEAKSVRVKPRETTQVELRTVLTVE